MLCAPGDEAAFQITTQEELYRASVTRQPMETYAILRSSLYAAHEAEKRAKAHRDAAARAVDRARESLIAAEKAKNKAEVSARSAARAALVAKQAAEEINRIQIATARERVERQTALTTGTPS
jgi:hypothetical protein